MKLFAIVKGKSSELPLPFGQSSDVHFGPIDEAPTSIVGIGPVKGRKASALGEARTSTVNQNPPVARPGKRSQSRGRAASKPP